MSECLSAECLDRYARGLLSESRRGQVEAHLAECPACRRALEAGRASPSAPGTGDSAVDGAADTGGNAPESQGRGIGPLPQISADSYDAGPDGKPPLVMFDDYQIIGELPQGGQAVVYKAIHKPTKSTVALKVLLPALLGSEKARWQFEREVELAASLSHPGIVAIRDSGISRGHYYFSMEYIRGKPLDQYVQAKSPSLRNKLVLFGKLCEAMTHAHQHGVIHRDLKPSNILVDDRGEPHVLDFGLAKAAGSHLAGSSAVLPSITGQIKGTLSYMSPEQAAGRTDLIDVRTDVYSLGVILYQMLMGKFPYDVSGSHVEVLRNIQEVDPARPRHTISRFDSDVEAILLKALAKDRDQRYQSAAELHHDVRCWLEGLPIVAKSVSSLYLLRKVIGRHRYTGTIAALLVIVLSNTFLVSYLSLRLRSEQTARESIVSTVTTLDSEAMQWAREASFLQILDLWIRDKMPESELTYGLGQGTKEEAAWRFLRNRALRAQNAEDFRRQAEDFQEQMDSSDEHNFGQFVMAEHLLKSGRRAEARQRFEACLSDSAPWRGSPLTKMRITLRCYDLSEADAPGAHQK